MGSEFCRSGTYLNMRFPQGVPTRRRHSVGIEACFSECIYMSVYVVTSLADGLSPCYSADVFSLHCKE